MPDKNIKDAKTADEFMQGIAADNQIEEVEEYAEKYAA